MNCASSWTLPFSFWNAGRSAEHAGSPSFIPSRPEGALPAVAPQPVGNEEGELQALLCIQPWVTVRVVTRGQVLYGYRLGASDALSDVLPRHLEMHTARECAHLLVHVKEGAQLVLRMGEGREEVSGRSEGDR